MERSLGECILFIIFNGVAQISSDRSPNMYTKYVHFAFYNKFSMFLF